MESITLRQSLQPTITELIKAIDYWSAQTVVHQRGSEHYVKLVKTCENIKHYILEDERKDNVEKLRVSSGSDGGLHEGTYDWVEELHREGAISEGNQYVRSDS